MGRFKKNKYQCSGVVEAKHCIRDIVKQCKKTEVFDQDFEKIPRTQLGDAFMISVGDIFSRDRSGNCQTIEFRLDVCCWYCSNNEQENEDDAIFEGEGLIHLILDPMIDYNEKCITSIRFDSFRRSPFNFNNDLITKMVISFTVRLDLDLSVGI